MCRREDLHFRHWAYESHALLPELRRQKANYFAFCRWRDHRVKHCDDARPRAEQSLQAVAVLREAESNGRLKVMSLARCLFSIPL